MVIVDRHERTGKLYDYSPEAQRDSTAASEVYERKEQSEESKGVESYGFRTAASDSSKENYRKSTTDIQVLLEALGQNSETANAVADSVVLDSANFVVRSNLYIDIQILAAELLLQYGLISDMEFDLLVFELSENLSFISSSHIEEF